jgi:hypothetical protein
MLRRTDNHGAIVRRNEAAADESTAISFSSSKVFAGRK